MSTPAGLPCESQSDHPWPGAVCQICHNPPSVPATNNSRRRSELSASAGVSHTPAGFVGSTSGGRPWDVHGDQPPLGVVCQMCHSWRSAPQTNSSRRPSVPAASAGLLKLRSVLGGAPCAVHPDHPPLGAVCHRCHSWWSSPTTKSSRRPCELGARTGGVVLRPTPAGVPWEVQSDQPPPGFCQMCHRASLLVTKTSIRPSALVPTPVL